MGTIVAGRPTSGTAPDMAEALRRRGNRVTPPRIHVWEVLREAREHLTAEEIGRRVNDRDPSINLSSVYRSLALFADLDMVRESNLAGDDAARWELAHPDEHFHLVCTRCGSVDHHRGRLVADIRRHLASSHGFVTEQVELVVSGLCRECHDPA
jgi:Fur family ferric uptake transcriptional regulator